MVRDRSLSILQRHSRKYGLHHACRFEHAHRQGEIASCYASLRFHIVQEQGQLIVICHACKQEIARQLVLDRFPDIAIANGYGRPSGAGH